MNRAAFVGCAGLIAFLGCALAPGCSQGQGTGSASGELDVPNCWSGKFDLKPDFFAAVPAAAPLPTLQLRIQNGGDYEAFSDGLSILVDDLGEVRGDPASDGTTRPSLLGQTLVVDLPVGVTTPGVLLRTQANPPIVHASLYLEKTCRTQAIALYALAAVTLNPDGTCGRPPSGEPSLTCEGPLVLPSDGGSVDAQGFPTATSSEGGGAGIADASGDAALADGATRDATASAPIGTSTIVFDSLFDGNPAESSAAQRLNKGHFEFYFADPRDICPGGFGPPPRCQGHLIGDFDFYFERGKPAQPFP